MEKITSFREEYRFLSNFHQCPFEYQMLWVTNRKAPTLSVLFGFLSCFAGAKTAPVSSPVLFYRSC